MANVTGSIKVTTLSSQVPASSPGSATAATIQQSPSVSFQTSGTAADQVDLKYSANLTLSATPTTLDLTSLLDMYGAAVNFARVRSITVVNKSTTSGQVLSVSGGASNPWTNFLSGTSPVLTVGPSTATNAGMLVMTNPGTVGWVVDGTHKTLKLDPGANTFAVDVEIMGASV